MQMSCVTTAGNGTMVQAGASSPARCCCLDLLNTLHADNISLNTMHLGHNTLFWHEGFANAGVAAVGSLYLRLDKPSICKTSRVVTRRLGQTRVSKRAGLHIISVLQAASNLLSPEVSHVAKAEVDFM